MAGPDGLVAHLRRQADACERLGSPLYAGLLAGVADDVEGGGICARVLAGHEQAPAGAATGLRLLGTVHRLVLERRAPALGLHYPSVGGRPGPPELLWQAFEATLDEHADAVRAGLSSPPQTNEVGRCAALLGGLLHAVAEHPLPVRLHEMGASAGLNLRADHFRYDAAEGPGWGPPDSPVRLTHAWRGATPKDAPLRVELRTGYDIAPVDPGTTEGRLLLSAYVWPDQVDRLARLRGAFAVAQRVPAVVHRTGIAAALAALRPTVGALTVVWHSVMWQYVPPAERRLATEALERLGAAATRQAPVAHLRLEPEPPGDRFPVRLRLWPGGADRLLAEAEPHGVPTTWHTRDDTMSA